MYINLLNFSRLQLIKLLAVIALSDGYIHRRKSGKISLRLYTTGNSHMQHKLLDEICEKIGSEKPKRYYYPRILRGKTLNYIASELYDQGVVKEVINLSPNFKTTPYKEDHTKFLKGPQPSIGFLLDESYNFKLAALKVWFDFDGSISPAVKLRNQSYVKGLNVHNYYQTSLEIELQIAETSPSLTQELILFLTSVGLNAKLRFDKRKWSGIDGVRIVGKGSIRKMAEIGPATDIPMSFKSKNFYGISKKVICKVVLSLMDEGLIHGRGFKDKGDAIAHREYLRRLLDNKITQLAPSSSGQG